MIASSFDAVADPLRISVGAPSACTTRMNTSFDISSRPALASYSRPRELPETLPFENSTASSLFTSSFVPL